MPGDPHTRPSSLPVRYSSTTSRPLTPSSVPQCGHCGSSASVQKTTAVPKRPGLRVDPSPLLLPCEFRVEAVPGGVLVCVPALRLAREDPASPRSITSPQNTAHSYQRPWMESGQGEGFLSHNHVFQSI